MTNDFKQLEGTYRGFGPTDESAIAMGELEVSITNEAMKIRHATGLKIQKVEIPLSVFTPMDKEELSRIYTFQSPYVHRSVGFSAKGMQYIFLPDATTNDEFGLLIRGNEMSDWLGPTLLYNPKQVSMGLYQKLVKELEDNAGKDCFPKLTSQEGIFHNLLSKLKGSRN